MLNILIVFSPIQGVSGKVSHLSFYFPLTRERFLFSAAYAETQIEEELRRTTLKPLQSTFLGKLDQYTPKGAVGKKPDETLAVLNEACTSGVCTYHNLMVDTFVGQRH